MRGWDVEGEIFLGTEVGLKRCQLRLDRKRQPDPENDNSPLPGETELVCLAGGGARLGSLEGNLLLVRKICGDCTIPEEIERRPCLFMIPFRVFEEPDRQCRFGCRFHYTAFPKRTPDDADMCMGCRDWFPAPQSWASIPDLPEAIQNRLHRFRTDVELSREELERRAHELWEEMERARQKTPKWRRFLRRVILGTP